MDIGIGMTIPGAMARIVAPLAMVVVAPLAMVVVARCPVCMRLS